MYFQIVCFSFSLSRNYIHNILRPSFTLVIIAIVVIIVIIVAIISRLASIHRKQQQPIGATTVFTQNCYFVIFFKIQCSLSPARCERGKTSLQCVPQQTIHRKVHTYTLHTFLSPGFHSKSSHKDQKTCGQMSRTTLRGSQSRIFQIRCLNDVIATGTVCLIRPVLRSPLPWL